MRAVRGDVAECAEDHRRIFTAQNEDKDLRTLTFFFTAAYTRPGAEMLENERRTRGQERRDGL